MESYNKQIVHFAPDEKFIKAAYELFEQSFPGKNHFIILKNDPSHPLKYIPSDIEYTSLCISDDYLPIIERYSEKAKIFIFHGMNFHQAKVAVTIHKTGKTLIWMVFGSEIYNNYYLFGKEIYGKKTYRKFVFNPLAQLKDKFRRYYYWLYKKQLEPKALTLKALIKMDYLGVLYREEYEMIKNKLGKPQNMHHITFTYYPIDIIIQGDRITGGNILIGNSASFTNNHIEAFEKIKNLDFANKKIIVPLSYGNNDYATEIIKEGQVSFGMNFYPLTEFLPLNEYQKILQECGIVVMNHYRQQAVGNVLNTMFMGAKAYLSTKNTLYHYLKRIGCYVFSIEDDLVPENKNAMKLLSKEQQRHNRHILLEVLNGVRLRRELQSKLII